MHRTCESRWFLDPADPAVAPLERFFAATTPERAGGTDAYLVTGRDDVGIKVRGRGGPDARLEIKLRQGALGPIALGQPAGGSTGGGPPVAATVEIWSKTVASRGSELEGEERWIEVHKERRLRRWAVRGDVVEERAAGPGEVESQVELCRARRGEVASVTFGVETRGDETHGDEADRVGAHLVVLRLVLVAAGVDALPGRDAIGYPAWLLR